MKRLNLSKFVPILIAALFLTACSSTGGNAAGAQAKDSGNLVVQAGPTHDWGDINIKGGKVSHDFLMTNDSQEPLFLKGAQTSCMCTTARYEFDDGTISPMYGMHNNSTSWTKEVAPNESFKVNVVFDPMAHGPNAVGTIKRSVMLSSSARGMSILNLDVIGNVLYEEDFENKN